MVATVAANRATQARSQLKKRAGNEPARFFTCSVGLAQVFRAKCTG